MVDLTNQASYVRRGRLICTTLAFSDRSLSLIAFVFQQLNQDAAYRSIGARLEITKSLKDAIVNTAPRTVLSGNV